MTEAVSYLDRWRARTSALKLKQQVVFGYGLGTALCLLGFARGCLMLNTRYSVWHAVMIAGAVAMLLTLILPSVWTWPESGFRWLTNKIGIRVLQLFLIISYYLVVCLAGWWLRRRQGRAPVWEWSHTPPATEIWRDKTALLITHEGIAQREHLLLFQPFLIVSFFLKHRMYIIIPSVIVLIVLGLILFFVQTSVLAPFIYTLF